MEKKITKKDVLLSIIIPTIISFLVSSLFCVDFNAVFAHLGFEKRQIIYADQCNKNYDDTNALKYYEIIGEGDSQYAPYANLACARIHDDLCHYNRALGFYKKAIVSDDLRVLAECMNFVIDQINKSSNNVENAINFFEDSNIKIVVELMNKINELDSDVFCNYNINFPIDETFVNENFNPDSQVIQTITYWKYDYTKIDTSSSLAYAKENEKLEYISSWNELIDPNGFSTINKYKYYHYVLKKETNKLPFLTEIKNSVSKYDSIYEKPISVALKEFNEEK